MSGWKDKSDREINKAVYNKKYGEPKSEFDHFFSALPKPNYCNNPSDAWPIIVENKITVDPSGCAWQHKPEPGDYHYDDGICNNFECENALRAAMIVFLEMNGVKP